MDAWLDWEPIADLVLMLPPHAVCRVGRDEVPHPDEAGFYRSTGLNRQAEAHYRFRLPDGRGIHVHEFAEFFHVHWDRIDPSQSVIGHFLRDVLSVAKREVLRILGRVPLQVMAVTQATAMDEPPTE